MSVVDFGDAMVETKQLAPGTRQDSIYQFGIKAGSPQEELTQWLLTTEPQSEKRARVGECSE
jgi:hypothetical protein